MVVLGSLFGATGFDQFLCTVLLGHEFPLAHMLLLLPISSPHLVREWSFLALGVLVGARGVETRIELARCLNMRKLAPFGRAICAIPAKRHRGMFEVAVGVGTMREELAQLFGLVR